ncbi:hypothetical protein GALMADRAFT_229773 [Galerina marginata CBS 339.88]|uniref:Uncharacterized protein n=1 Tax=Galerina marginata (strain CBS 339.88) TaxID=685588 RepID=A0A067STU7_GALM3|nr:hypothetical protein GALMADRAFT_229773 [Galerina marginata CBS 339.88]
MDTRRLEDWTTWLTASSSFEIDWRTSGHRRISSDELDWIQFNSLPLMSSLFLETSPGTFYQGSSACFPAVNPSRDPVVNVILDSTLLLNNYRLEAQPQVPWVGRIESR